MEVERGDGCGMMIIKTMLRWLLDVAVPVAAFYIALIERKEEKETIRTGNLKRILNNIRGTRHRYSDAALTFYRRQFAEQQDVCVEYTIFRRKWMQQEKDSDFLMLSDIQIRPNQAFWNSAKNPEPRFLPRRKNGYAEEVKAISNVKLINLPAYALSDVQIEKIGNKRTITLDVYGGYYFDFYDTCEVLGAELAHAENCAIGQSGMRFWANNPPKK